MFKLLPEEAKAKVIKAYTLRLKVVTLLSLIVVLLVGMAGLFPAYVLSKVRKSEVSERLKVTGSLVPDSERKNFLAWLEGTNLKLKLLTPALDKQHTSDAMEKVINTKPSGVRLTVLDWAQSGGDMVLAVSGIARDRQALIDFERMLNNSGNFSEVALPVSNLAKDRDIPFQVKLSPIF